MSSRYSQLAAQACALAVGFGIALAGVPNHAALAAESLILPNPTGGTDINQATLGPPGLYGFLVGLPYNQATTYTDQNGNTSKAEQYNNPTMLGGLSLVYPWKVLGGNFASSIVLQEHASCLSLNGVLHSCYPGGLGDTYSDLLYWTRNVGLFGMTPGNNPHLKYGLNVALGFAAKFPTGPYSAVEPKGISAGGNNLFVWVPNLALTYNTGPNWSFFDSTQVSARLYYAFPMINPATNYQSGQVLDVDFSGTQLWGRWRFGVAGSFADQVTDDTQNGVVVPAFDDEDFGAYGTGKEWQALYVGPVVAYTWPNGIQFKAKYTQDVYTRAQVNTNTFVVSVGFKLW